MLKLTFRNLRANISRLVATALAIATGTSFLAAGLMLTDSLSDSVRGSAELLYATTDLAVVAGYNSEDPWAALPSELLDAVRATAGVDAASGEYVAETVVLDDTGASVRSRSLGRAWIDSSELNPVTISEGRAPESGGEIAVDVETAEQGSLGVGDQLQITTPSGPVDAELVGITEFGKAGSIDNGGTIHLEPDWATEILTGGNPGWQKILISTDDPEAVQAALEAEVGGAGDVLDHAELIEEESAAAEAFVSFLSPVLTGFAVLALFVAGFVIYNTFTVVVTQRSQELALVRAIGGTPAQVRRSLILEGLLLGALASAAGLALGLGISKLIEVILGRFDIRLPGSGLAVSPRIVLITILAGMLITLVSTTIPSWRAGRTRPVEAMRSSAVDDSASSRFRMILGGILLVSGILLLSINAFVQTQWYYLAPGALFLFLGVVIGGPLLAKLYARLAKLVMGVSLTGRIAADNMARNPKRTATTANALVIGLFLVTFVTLSGTALKDWIQGEIQDISESDYIVFGSTPLSQDILDGVSDIDGVTASSEIRSALLDTPGGVEAYLSGADIDSLQDTVGLRNERGSLEAVAAGEGAANGDLGAMFGEGSSGGDSSDPSLVGLNGSFNVIDLDGQVREITVVATYDAGLDTLLFGSIVSNELLTEIAGDIPVSQVYIRADPAQVDEVGKALDDLVRNYTSVEVIPGNFIGQTIGQAIDFMIAAVNGLLGLSVLIALVGIVNTLNLSIHERRRELGMVRALGMLGSQVRNMVRIEGILIGLLGTTVGVGSGVLVGWSAVVGLTGTALSFPLGRIGLIVGAGVVISLLACLLPARSAVKVPMLEAMAAT